MRKLLWFFILVLAIAVTWMGLYIGLPNIVQPPTNVLGSAIIAALAGVQQAIVSSWVWQNFFLPYGFFPFGLIWVACGLIVAWKAHSIYDAIRIRMWKSAQKEAGLTTTVMPTAPAMTVAQNPTVTPTTPIIPLSPEPEKKNQ